MTIHRTGPVTPGPDHILQQDCWTDGAGDELCRNRDYFKVVEGPAIQGVFAFTRYSCNVENGHEAIHGRGPLGDYEQDRAFTPDRVRLATRAEIKRAQDARARAFIRAQKAEAEAARERARG